MAHRTAGALLGFKKAINWGLHRDDSQFIFIILHLELDEQPSHIAGYPSAMEIFGTVAYSAPTRARAKALGQVPLPSDCSSAGLILPHKLNSKLHRRGAPITAKKRRDTKRTSRPA